MPYSQPTQQTSAQTQSLVYLSSQLGLLSQRTEQLSHLTRVAAEQANDMRQLAAIQGAVLMAAQKVFIPQDDVDQEDERAQQQALWKRPSVRGGGKPTGEKDEEQDETSKTKPSFRFETKLRTQSFPPCAQYLHDGTTGQLAKDTVAALVWWIDWSRGPSFDE
ncbi:DASH complex subunit HSK3 family protein [Sporobolomyces salmoneus]|uniref:DASH complex subunit HSK3 family protein n=1 Tax=Sporobolomyces salmoneus TaxID=183962 RepID=UPI00317A3457